jgi:putative acetyltransferase
MSVSSAAPGIRLEMPGDCDAVRHVHLESFPSAMEADLVDALRVDGDSVLSLIAEMDGIVAGHALFSRMASPPCALGLAPVAVLPSFRYRGCAAHLIEAGLVRAASQGWHIVFVLGGPYYHRFGFDPARAAQFQSPYAGPHFMAKAISADAPRGGVAAYAPAFARLE